MNLLVKADIKDKVVLIRSGLNVPIEGGVIQDDTRIQAALPTIQHCLKHAKQVIICSHLGRPKGNDPSLSLRPIAKHLSKLIKHEVTFVENMYSMPQNKIVLLENLRFTPEEKENNPKFAKDLANLADVFILDAFADMHRKHASTYGVAQHLPSYAGLLVQREVTMLERVVNPAHPYVALLGFAKIADKLALLEKLLPHVDRVMFGGAVVFTFFKAAGIETGKSLVEDEMIPTVRKMIRKYGKKIQLPTDIVVASSPTDPINSTVPYNKIPKEMMGVDIGPVTTEAFSNTLLHAHTVFWNGPVGVFEHPPYNKATNQLAITLASLKTTTVVGGGDTVSAVQQAGVAKKLSHVSTGGGATLLFLSHERLPGLEVLKYY